MRLMVGGTADMEIKAQRPARGQTMTITRKLTAITTAAAIAIGSLGTLTTAAEAGPRHGGPGYGKHYHGKSHYRGPRGRYAHRHYRKRDNTGKYIAIGAAALMLGVIASEASRR